MYVTINRRFDDRIRVSYSTMEDVGSIENIQHGLVREALRLTGIESGVEITTIADIPGQGTGTRVLLFGHRRSTERDACLPGKGGFQGTAR